MPAKSKAQARFMHGVAEGSIKVPGLKPEQAQEFIDATKTPYKKLPEEVEEHHRGITKRFTKLFAPKS